MKSFKILSMLVLISLVSCGKKDIKATDLAAQAMERARAAEADIYAPQEYAVADNFFQQMQEAMDTNDLVEANNKALLVVDAANVAIKIARQNKATALIAQLKRMLETAQQIGVDQENPNIYAQATQFLIDAEGFYSQPDYDKAINAAQSGLDLLEPLVGGAEALALANLNRARELLDRAYKSTDLSQTKTQLEQAADIIAQSALQYQNKEYNNSLRSSQKAIDILENLIAKYPGDGSISLRINDDENLQLQAYDLIRRLGATIKFIKDNNYTEDVYTDSSRKAQLLVPAKNMKSQENAITNSTDTEDTDVEMFLYEDEIDEEILSYMMPTQLKAQLQTETVNTADNVITIQMIENFYASSQEYYDEGNYLTAIDQAREGLRLADLYLANQTLFTHTVVPRDTLWDISKRAYKTPWLWPNIWRANKLDIKDPDLIYPGQKFRIPPALTNPN